MVRTLVLSVSIFALIGGAAHGAEGPATHAPCKALAKLKAEFDAKTHFAVLTPGQFRFIEGVYVGSPATPDGLPPGDGAILVSHDGDKDGAIIWTRGPLACAPTPVSEKLIKLLAGVKTGEGEDGDAL